jgi:ABC-2 type transport system permease protein
MTQAQTTETPRSTQGTQSEAGSGARIAALWRKELGSFFAGPIAYIVIALFLLITGFLFFQTFFIFNQAEMRGFFQMLPLLFAFFIPAVTMRAFAEERRAGTFETLLTLPLKEYEIVLGKFLAVFTFTAIMLAPSLLYLFSILVVGTPDAGPIIGGYLGALLLATEYCMVGLFASALTRNQIVAFIAAFAICIFMSLIDQFLILLPVNMLDFLEYIGSNYHFSSIARGVIDTRNLIYFLSVSAAFGLATVKVIEEKR